MTAGSSRLRDQHESPRSVEGGPGGGVSQDQARGHRAEDNLPQAPPQLTHTLHIEHGMTGSGGSSQRARSGHLHSDAHPNIIGGWALWRLEGPRGGLGSSDFVLLAAGMESSRTAGL